MMMMMMMMMMMIDEGTMDYTHVKYCDDDG
jgi:hypothetical protein